MPRSIEDIIPSGKRSIRNIPVPARRATKTEKVKESEGEEVKITRRDTPRREVVEEEVFHPKVKNSNPKRKIYFAGSIGFVALIFFILSFFEGGTLIYTPKKVTATFTKDVYTAYQTPEEGKLSYSVIKLSGDKAVNVSASGEETVSEKASGTVVIYNEQTTAQALVSTTRLETGDGKIYRIQREVNIPAKGSVEVVALADVAGPSHNIGLSDFTIPGFKGTAKYEKVYARSKTAMTGGFTGTRKKVSETDLKNARGALEASIKDDLLTQARAQMPQGFIIYPDLAQITYEVLPVESAGENGAKITVRGHLNAVMFKQSVLSDFLIQEKLKLTSGTASIPDLSALSIIFSGTQAGDLTKAESIRVEVSGSAQARYITDETLLARDLVGVEKDKVNQALSKYTSIEGVTVSVSPFWKSSFPSDATKIKIEAKNE